MAIITKEHLFETRIANSIKRLIADTEDPINSDEMMDLIWSNLEAFGRIVYEDMCEWQTEEEWHEMLD